MKKERTLAYCNPELINEWHPLLNEDKTPYNTSYGSGYKAWWILRYNDARTGNIFEFEWQAAVYHRSAGENCPYLTGKKVYAGFNDIASISPKLKGQVHPQKNNGLSACDIFAFSNKKIWWQYPYDDPKTGKHFDFEWEARITNRVQDDNKCPFLSNNAVWKNFNDLASKRPELADEWDYEKNRGKTPEMFTKSSNKKVWWKCEQGHEWRAEICHRTQIGHGCPICAKNRRK